ncbi:MAG: prepilin-type N-terminal cleavage/methylation domain-containing protein [Myxococcales bacterium]|nr:prepilin-type N-terminal cleavage/methylation domain-containing protein [Myxococcales bacterium]
MLYIRDFRSYTRSHRSAKTPVVSVPKHRCSKGMTLLEVSLAVTILAMIGVLTWGSIARSFDAFETVKSIDSRYHAVRVAMNRMAKELSMAYLTAPTRHKGQERRVQQFFKYTRGSPLSQLHFSAFAHNVFLRNAKESDQAEISYFGARDPDERNMVNLMRRESPRIDTDYDDGGRVYILAENVKAFELRFFDLRKQDWTDTWDTERAEYVGRLPSIVEIKLTIVDEDGLDLAFVTKTRINLVTQLN